MSSRVVCVTGASGFIASHVIKQLQEQGYRVRGTVRNLENEEKLKPLYELAPEADHKLELVEADLLKAETWEPAIKGCDYVIHVASPFPNAQPKDEKEVIEPAVEGTKNVLKACVVEKVKRVVLTSSCVAVSGGLTANDPEKVFAEEDWSDPEKVTEAYTKSKTLAEKAAWDYVKELSVEDKIEIATINPGYVLGPVVHGTAGTSTELCRRLLERSMPACPRLNFPIVDVRDVALAHIKAMTSEEAAGHRHLLVGSNMWLREMAQILAKEFKPRGYNVPTANCPYFAAWIYGLFDKTTKMVLPNIGKVTKFDNTRMKEKLEIEPRNAEETLLEMCNSMIDKGMVKKPKPKKEKKKKEVTEPAEAGEAKDDMEVKDSEEIKDRDEKKQNGGVDKEKDGETATEKNEGKGEEKKEEIINEENKKEEIEEKKDEEKEGEKKDEEK
ncbi:uncharacterized protein LOC135494439 isoform X2 [Lineus longissimus]|uniref:uncharacterized protein LOC135494439 isoform X2 n=1 Tax=Lineus longissimus TaxID=88925 RepID=UPI002B4EA036